MIKFIHCSDVHLLTPYRTRLTFERAGIRQAEAFSAFENMLEYGKAEGVQFVLITGDLFDGDNIDIFGFNMICALFNKYPKIDFYIVCGNYDPYSEGCPYDIFRFPKNVYVFKSRWDKSVKKGYAVSGFSLYDGDKKVSFDGYRAEPDSVNIVCMHGIVPGVPSPLEYNVLDLKSLRGKKIDYLALGHVHHYNKGNIEGTDYAYAGVLESRDFTDRSSGFILGRIDDGKITTEYIKKEIRRHRVIKVNFPPLSIKAEQLALIDGAIKDARAEDLVRLELSGEVSIDNMYGEKWLLQQYKSKFFYLEVDNSAVVLSAEWLKRLDPATMAGSYYEAVMANGQLAAGEKEKILQFGLEALSGAEAAK